MTASGSQMPSLFGPATPATVIPLVFSHRIMISTRIGSILSHIGADAA